MAKLRVILAKNEYPEFVVQREIDKFMHNKSQHLTSAPSIEPNQVLLPERCKKYIVLPYTNQKAEGFSKKLKAHIIKYYPQVDFNVAFKTPNEIGKFFPFKDRITDPANRSKVVYQVRCMKEDCDAVYIGKTIKSIKTRMAGHVEDPKSACFKHDLLSGHHMDYDNAEVIDSSDSNFRLLIKEMLHILHRRPKLNVQLGDQDNYTIKTLIVANYPRIATCGAALS